MLKNLALLLPIFLVAKATYANESSVQKFVDSIKSVEQVKKEIRSSLTEECGGGHCWNFHASRICDLTAALDVRVGYAITGTFENAKRSIQISEADLRLMKLIFSQCKPSNYQYWNNDRILHVTYDPSQEINTKIKIMLGIRKY